MKPFVAGVVAIALLTGTLVGGSDSPVAGVAITAVFGLVAAVVALYKGQVQESPQDGRLVVTLPAVDLSEMLNALGRVLTLFCIAFIVGLGVGIFARGLSHLPKAEVSLPWDGLEKPPTAAVAADWIVARKLLREMGYSNEQIATIYKLDLENLKSTQSSAKDLVVKSMVPRTALSSILRAPVGSAPAAAPPGTDAFITWEPKKREEGRT
jgi:hypothetical protein